MLRVGRIGLAGRRVRGRALTIRVQYPNATTSLMCEIGITGRRCEAEHGHAPVLEASFTGPGSVRRKDARQAQTGRLPAGSPVA